MNDLPKSSRMSCRFFRRYRSDPPTPIRAATRSNRRRCTTPGKPRWIGSVTPESRIRAIHAAIATASKLICVVT